jgi:alanine racemase
MDMCMVDISGHEIKEGDEAIFFGKGLSIESQCENIGIIPYELLTSISSRVKRIYVKEEA